MQRKVYLMDALPGFYQIKNIPQGFQYFLSSRVLPFALFGEATIVVYEECRKHLQPYYRFFPKLEKSIIYAPGDGTLAERVQSGGLTQYFPRGAKIYTTYPSQDLLTLARDCQGTLAGYSSKYPNSTDLHKGVFYPVWGEGETELATAARGFGLAMPGGYLVRHNDATSATEAFDEMTSLYGEVVCKPVLETGNGDGVTVRASLDDVLRLVQEGDTLITQVASTCSIDTPLGYKTELSLSVCGVDGRAMKPSFQILREKSWVGCFVHKRYKELGVSRRIVKKARDHAQWVLDTLDVQSICGFDFLVGPSGQLSLVDFNFRFPGSYVPTNLLSRTGLNILQPVLYEPFELYGDTTADILEALNQESLLLDKEGFGILPLDLPCGYRKAYVGGRKAMAHWQKLHHEPMAV